MHNYAGSNNQVSRSHSHCHWLVFFMLYHECKCCQVIRIDGMFLCLEHPEIKGLEPANQVRHIGNFTILTCMVTGAFSKVNFRVSWYRNGVKLSQSSRISMRYATYRDYRNYTLNVTNLNKDLDSGMYQCFARNDGGEDMAYTAINVQSKKFSIEL